MQNKTHPRITYRNLPQLLLKARDRLMSHFRPILNQFGITEQQWRILRVLDEHEQLEPREICEMCQILSPSMAGVLARMEDTGLIRRNRVVGDQRRVMVRLAKKGEELITAIAPLIDARYHEMEHALGKDIFDDLFHALERFIAVDETAPSQESPEEAESIIEKTAKKHGKSVRRV